MKGKVSIMDVKWKLKGINMMLFIQYEFPKATAFLKEMEAELANQPGAQKKRKIDDVETEDGSKESKAEEKAEPATDSSSKPEIDADLPDVNMNVEPKVGPIDEERPYKKASGIVG